MEEEINIIDKNTTFNIPEFAPKDNNIYNGIDLSTIPIQSLVVSNEWQMRIYGYEKLINEMDLGEKPNFLPEMIPNMISDKNVTAQGKAIQAISKYISLYCSTSNTDINLRKAWKEDLVDILIKKTLYNPKTSNPSISLVASIFETSLLIEGATIDSTNFLWEDMNTFLETNRKAKGLVIKQILGIVSLYLNMIENYGIEYLPITQWCNKTAFLLADCSDKSVRDSVYSIFVLIFSYTKNIDDIIQLLSSPQQQEVEKRCNAITETNGDSFATPLKREFLTKLQNNKNLNDEKFTKKGYLEQGTNQLSSVYDIIEAVDVIHMLPNNWLNIVGSKEIKWNERKAAIDQLIQLCEKYPKLAISQNDNPKASNNQNTSGSNSGKGNSPPSLSDFQNMFSIFQRMLKLESNIALLVSLLRLIGSLSKGLRGRISNILRPTAVQIMVKLKDQNRSICNEAVNSLMAILTYSCTLDQLYEDLNTCGLKAAPATAKCSAISIFLNLIDIVIEKKDFPEKHLKGFKMLVNDIPPLLDDASAQVRSSASVILIKLRDPIFGSTINSNANKIFDSLNNAKQKLLEDTKKKLGISEFTTVSDITNTDEQQELQECPTVITKSSSLNSRQIPNCTNLANIKNSSQVSGLVGLKNSIFTQSTLTTINTSDTSSLNLTGSNSQNTKNPINLRNSKIVNTNTNSQVTLKKPLKLSSPKKVEETVQMNSLNKSHLAVNKSTKYISQPKDNSCLDNLSLSENLSISGKYLQSLPVIETPKTTNMPTMLQALSSHNRQNVDFKESIDTKINEKLSCTLDYISNMKSLKIEDTTRSVVYIDQIDSQLCIYASSSSDNNLSMNNSEIPQNICKYLTPLVSTSLLSKMFSDNLALVNDAIRFWSGYFMEENQNESVEKVVFIKVLLLWLAEYTEKRIILQYDNLLLSIFHIINKCDKAGICNLWTYNMTYILYYILINILIYDLFQFQNDPELCSFESEKYEKIGSILLHKYIEIEDEDYMYDINSINRSEYLDHKNFVISTILIIALNRNEINKPKVANMLKCQMIQSKDETSLFTSFGLSNILLLIDIYCESVVQNLDYSNSALKDLLWTVANICGYQMWNYIVSEFSGNCKTEIILNDINTTNNNSSTIEISKSLEHSISSNSILTCTNLFAKNILWTFNMLGFNNTLGPKKRFSADMTLTSLMSISIENTLQFQIENLFKLLPKVLTIEDTSIVSSQSSKFVLFEHIKNIYILGFHIFFSLPSIMNLNKYQLNDSKKIVTSPFYGIIDHMEQLSSIYQSFLIRDEYPTKAVIFYVLLIMSNYFSWKENIQDENLKTNLVTSLNNIMGNNIISAYQQHLPKLVVTVFDVILKNDKGKNHFKFDKDLLQRLLPKILRRVKASFINMSCWTSHISSIEHCIECLFEPNANPSESSTLVGFTIDYIALILENGHELFRMIKTNEYILKDFIKFISSSKDQSEYLYNQQKVQYIQSFMSIPTNYTLDKQ
ncbi:hypothetical protein ACR3K2_05980 [Cryptosporidium serpentis]